MNGVWSKNPAITRMLVRLWEEGMLEKNIAATLSREFQVQLTGASVGGKVHRLGLKLRSESSPNKKPKAQEQTLKPDKKVFFEPSLPPIPKSKFFDVHRGETAEYSEKY